MDVDDTAGVLAPDTPEEARTLYESLGPTAQVLTKEIAKAMEFDPEEYSERVTGEVVETARDALFASLLEVREDSLEGFEAWREDYDGDVDIMGAETVDHVVWHAFDGRTVAATYQNEPEAARGTLRRLAFGRLYRDVVNG